MSVSIPAAPEETGHRFPQSTEPSAQRVLTTHWQNVDHVSFLAADFAVTVSLEDQADMKGEKGYLRVGAQSEEAPRVTLCQGAQESLPGHFEAF